MTIFGREGSKFKTGNISQLTRLTSRAKTAFHSNVGTVSHVGGICFTIVIFRQRHLGSYCLPFVWQQ